MPEQTPAEAVAFTADLMLTTHPTAREQAVAELLNYVANTWDQHPASLRDHAAAVARAHDTDPKTLPTRLQQALDTMVRRGPVTELTASACASTAMKDTVVAHRSRDGRQLRCPEHTPTANLIGIDWHPLTAALIDGDGSKCTECGVDVLA